MKSNYIVALLALGIAFLAFLAALFGILTLDLSTVVEYTTIRSETVAFVTNGLYRYNPVWFVVEGIAWDYVTLFFAIPLLLISFFMFMRNSMRGFLGLLGASVYFFYQYMLWATTLSYNSFFLIYTSICSLSFVLCIVLLGSFSLVDFNRAVALSFPRRSLSIFLGFLGVFFAFMWLSAIAPTVFSGEVPAQFVGVPTLVVQAYDLALLIPLAVYLSFALWYKFSWAYLLSSVLVIKFTFLSVAIIAMILVKYCMLSEALDFSIFPLSLLTFLNVYFLVRIWKSCKKDF